MFVQGDWQSEHLTKTPLIYSVLYFKLNPQKPRGEDTGQEDLGILDFEILYCPNQGCGVGVEESEGFWTWGVGVAENLNDSDSGQTFCSPIVTVCSTNVRKHHTWQFKQLNLSTKDDHG